MRTIYETLMALIPGSDANHLLRLQRERPTRHPGSKNKYNHRREKTRRLMAAASNRINRRRVKRWSH
jgi:hypothetical protein